MAIKLFGLTLAAMLLITALPVLAQQATCTVNGEEVPCPEALQDFGDAAGKAVGIFSGVAIVLGIISILWFIFWLMMLVHAATKPIENKAMWIILIVIFSGLGAIVYYFVVKRKFNKAVQQPPTPGYTP